MFNEWFDRVSENLPGCRDDLFMRLWKDRRLKYGGVAQQPHDEIDTYCARLASAAISSNSHLLLIFPDSKPHRPCLLFTTALLRSWYDLSRQVAEDKRNFLYFGTTIGIREHLNQVRIQGFSENLASVFQQYNFGRGGGRGERNASETAPSQLPRVFTFYSPADPLRLIEQYTPQCIAVDINDSARAEWLAPLLEEATRRQIPVIAWGTNPLSDCLKFFRKYGQVCTWPPTPSHLTVTSALDHQESSVHPLVLESSDVDELKSAFGNAAQLLAKTVQTVQNRFGQDAIRQHYWYLRSLESLSVPLRFYEAEAGRFWGMKTFSHVRAGCEHFLRACEASDQLLKRELSKVYEVCSLVEERMKSAGPPLWDALCNLCVDEPNSDEARLIVFSGQSRKHLFLLALLAYYNVTENDLREVKTWAVTLEEFRYLIRDGNVSNETCANGLSRVRGVSNWRPLLVGLPSTNMNSKLLPVFLQPNIDFVIYPHQLGLLRRRIDDWAQALTLDVNNLVGVLRRCGGSLVEDALEVDSTIKPRVKPSQPVTLSAGTARRRALTNIESLWQAEALSDEVSSLLEVEDQHLDGEPQFHESRQPAENEDSNTWCDEAVELRFESGTAITFPSDEFINVIVAGDSGLEIDERAVRSLRKGDRVVLIHGQKRQSFYELIISRLHQHPSLLLHLSLIRRWQTDFISSFNRWRLHEGRTLEQFLNLMRERGSELTSTATIQSWLRGQTLCPQDAEDLRRISEVLGLEFIRQNYIRVGRAASRLRGLHRGMANKLNRWLQQQAIGIDSGNDDELIDQDLGLTFGDIRSSLSIEMVSDKSIIEGPVLRGSLGRLEV